MVIGDTFCVNEATEDFAITLSVEYEYGAAFWTILAENSGFGICDLFVESFDKLDKV